MDYRELLKSALVPEFGAALIGLGFVKSGRLGWRRAGLEVRVVIDSKAVDPFRGGAFTLEFERSDNGKFGEKLAGRVRLEQLLDNDQRVEVLSVRNVIAARLPRPDERHLALIPESMRPAYLKAFQSADRLGPRFWMRFQNERDLLSWSAILQKLIVEFVSRAEAVDPHALVMGKALGW
jgi:hypothetical protein